MTQQTETIVDVDFETYYDEEYSLRNLGVHAYVDDPRFHADSVALKRGSDEWAGPPENAPWEWCHNAIFAAHNAGFDDLVFRRLQKDGVIPSDIVPSDIVCTADLAVFKSANRALAKAAPELVGLKVDKTMRRKMQGVTLEEAEKRGWGKEALDYVMGDAIASFSIAEQYLPDWPTRERKISNLTREAGDKGIHINASYVAEAIGHFRRKIFAAEKLIPWEWPADKTPLAAKYLKAECRKSDIPCPSSWAQDNPECMEWEDLYSDRFPWVQAVRDWRRTNMILKKFEAIQTRIRPDGTMPFRIKYMGAHTGRFSGDNGCNMQNLNRNDFDGYYIRHCFVPRPGKKFAVLDYCGIEPRVLMRKTGDQRQLDMVRQGMDVYEVHARATMGYKDERPLASVPGFGSLRRLAKARVLGLGYGCGAVKFALVAKIMTGLEITASEAVAIVDDFRLTNPLITNYWTDHGQWMAYSADKKDPTHVIELLSGRELTYFNPRWEKRHFVDSTGKPYDRTGLYAQTTRGAHYLGTWGGKLTENDIQAESRDILCDGILKLDAIGFAPLWHVHDEVIVEVDEDCAEEQFELVKSTLETPPDWLEGFPLDVEGKLVDHYQKV